MFDALKNGDLVITNNKLSILNYLNDSKKLLNLKIMTLKEFKDKYFGYYDERAIYYLVNKYNYKYDVAKLYLDNFLFIDTLSKELYENDLIIKEPLFKTSFKRIVIDCEIDPYIQKEIEKYDFIKITKENKNYIHPVHEFDTIEDEINFVCIEILKLIETVDINKIHLTNVTSEYELVINRMFNFYNIPINLNINNSVYGTLTIQKFISDLKSFKSIDKALELLENNDIYNIIIDVCNKYRFKELDDTIIYLIIEELKKNIIRPKRKEKAIDVCDINNINSDEYYFILGFNQGILPKIYKDEDYLSDIQKQKLGIFTSLEKNKIEKNKIKNILSNNKNLILSYKLKSDKEYYDASCLIEDLNLEIIREDTNNYNYSNIYNKLVLSKKLDKLIKFNEKEKDLNLLYSNYQNILYSTYDNSYKNIDKNLFKEYINNNLLLSYSSLDNYYRCGFRYYITNILKLNKYEETFSIYIGNLFHYILSKAFNNDFDFEYEFNNYIKDYNGSNKDKFFINKLKKDLLFTIETIKKQDSYTDLNNALYEQKIYVNKDKSIKITFMGVIDKLKYTTTDKTIVAIIDYKTGDPKINLNDTIYGISMQLPIYLYLAFNSSLKNVTVAGFYLQKIIHNKLNYKPNKDYNLELEKEYKLEGYSNSNEDILKKLDKNYVASNMIKSMQVTSKGFYKYAKVLNDNQMNCIISLVDNKIDEAIDNILDTNFNINPKKIGDELKGCEYCKFKDICYMKKEDIVNLKPQNYTDFLGGE
jgi:hypothetical protein